MPGRLRQVWHSAADRARATIIDAMRGLKVWRVGGGFVRNWNDQDVKRARKYRTMPYYKGGARKRKRSVRDTMDFGGKLLKKAFHILHGVRSHGQ